MSLSWFLRLYPLYGLLTAYFLYEEVMSVRLYENIGKTKLIMQLLSHGAESFTVKKFVKYEKQGKYLPNCKRQCAITTLSLNTCWNQMWKVEEITKLTWLCFYLHISIRIFWTVYLFCTWLFFAINLFSNVLFQTFDYFWKYVPTKLLISLCWQI